MDGAEGRILWIKIALLAAIGVVLPLIEPRRYMPQDPKVLSPQNDQNKNVLTRFAQNPLEPHPEQTASIFSYATFTYLQPIVSLAYRVPHLPFDHLPPLADYDHSEKLVSSTSKVRNMEIGREYGLKRAHLVSGLVQWRAEAAPFLRIAQNILCVVHRSAASLDSDS